MGFEQTNANFPSFDLLCEKLSLMDGKVGANDEKWSLMIK